MLSKKIISLIRSLQQKKFREEERLFIVEGRKVVDELLSSGFDVKMIVATEDHLSSLPEKSLSKAAEVHTAKQQDLERMTALSTPQEVIAVAAIPDSVLDAGSLKSGWTFMLDDIRDPGNMGTILRIAHWFGVGQVVCSLNSVDVYNPKVVQASMGSLFHVPVHYAGLEGVLSQLQTDGCPDIIAAVLDGEDLYTSNTSDQGIILLGNESVGIRNSLLDFANRKITIPSFERQPGHKPDSLNVAVSAALLIAAFRSRN